jgi:outer membrane protein OmpA-like peptidoglycan-associated protein
MLICLVGAAAYAQPAVIAPNTGGDIGLFTMTTADGPRAGQFTLGFYGWYAPQIAGPYLLGQPSSTRYFSHWGGALSAGVGLTNWWSISIAGGGQVTRSGGGWQGGYINGIPLAGPFKITEGSKIRLGTKISFHAENDPDLRFAGWLAGYIPVGNASIQTSNGAVVEALNSGRSDWEWGGAISKSIFTGMISYTLTGFQDNDVRPGNLLRFGFGAEVPVTPLIHVIGEAYYNVLDGGDNPEPDWGSLVTGARIWFGHTGWALSVALNTNLSMLFAHGINPNPFGGILGVTYAAWPPAPPPPVVVPAPAEPVVEETAAAPIVAAVAPAQQPPPRPAPRTTTDEIFFDGKSARLTNIAKAVLDGVALRMKNDLNATAVVLGYTDNAGADQANLDLGMKRAEAAKQYLVTRHGIDPGRISAGSKGVAEPAYDNATAEGRAKNRRAQIVVTLVSGT